MPIRARKSIRVGSRRLHVAGHFTQAGFTSWSVKVGPWSWNSRTRAHRVETLLLIGLGWLVVYAARCYWWPYTRCSRRDCEGGKLRAPGRKTWRRCTRESAEPAPGCGSVGGCSSCSARRDWTGDPCPEQDRPHRRHHVSCGTESFR
jgi:hypothetical protein